MMPTFNNLIKDLQKIDLQKKEFFPVYLLYGEEPYYIDLISDYMIENVLDETKKAFNQVVLYGRDTSSAVLVDQCKRFPMMGNVQLVALREAQDMDLKKDEYQQHIISYLKNPSSSTILILCFKYKSPPVKVMNAAKKEDKRVILFESKKKSEQELPVWISEEVKENGYNINNKACGMLIEFLGNNLEKIANELGKLYINLPKEKQITEDVIENYIGISKDYNVFELQNALGTRNISKANRIISHFAANTKQNPMIVVLSVLFGFFMKLMIYHQLKDKSKNIAAAALSVNPYFIKDYTMAAENFTFRQLRAIIGLLREYDLRLKGINNGSTEESELLRELVYKILH